MVPSSGCAASSLLCTEEESLVFDDDALDSGVLEESYSRFHHSNHGINKRNRSFYEGEILNGLPMQSEESMSLMIKRECEHLPASDYSERLKNGDLDLRTRQEIVDWIQKVHSYFSFGPLCLYLSINYLDRFLSGYKLPTKPWMMQLLAVACLSLASKMEETELPYCQDLQVADSKFIFEARTIQRMELLVLSTLGWRMQAVTPFSFVDYFLRKICGDQIDLRPSITKATELILRMIEGIKFLEFRPSEMAAAVAIHAAAETQAVNTSEAVSALIQEIEKDRILKCVDVIQELVLVRGHNKVPSFLVSSVPQSPIGVLDAGCFSYKTDDTAVESCTNSSHSSPVAKRRKVLHF